MRSRGLVVAIAVVLAVLAAVGVIVYTSGVRESATTENTKPVLVSTQDIQANTALDPLIEQNVFQIQNVPDGLVLAGAVTDVSELQGQTATAPIYQNEQIPIARISAGASNNLGIDPGNIGVGLLVDGPNSVNGYVQQGDNVTMYATFPQGTLITKSSLKQLLAAGGSVGQVLGGTSTSGSGNVVQVQADFTITLIPSVEVLSVQNPATDPESGRATSGASTFVLNLTPTDAQELVFAIDHAKLYMGLLPPDNDKGYAVPGTVGVPVGKVVGLK